MYKKIQLASLTNSYLIKQVITISS